MRVALITGASSGIGRAAARLFAQQGYVVYAAARRVDSMAGLDAHGVYLDVTDKESCESCIRQIVQREGHIDVLVNNAGYGEYGPVTTMDLERARAQLEVNLFGAVRMAQLAAAHMGRHGRIINVSSAGGRAVTYLGGWYHAAKYALEAVSDAMRMELSGRGIDVVLIEPGGVRSAWGAIAADHLQASGAGTAYEAACDSVAAVYRAVYRADNRVLTSPDVVARRIVRAAAARRPRTRYLFGFGARALVLLHAVLPNRAFDRLMKGMYTSKPAKRLAASHQAGESD